MENTAQLNEHAFCTRWAEINVKLSFDFSYFTRNLSVYTVYQNESASLFWFLTMHGWSQSSKRRRNSITDTIYVL